MNDGTALAAPGDSLSWLASLADSLGWLPYFVLMLLVAAMGFVAAHWWLAWYLNKAIERSRSHWDDILRKNGVFRWLANLAPALVIYFGVGVYSFSSEARRIILACLVIIATIVVNRLLSSALGIYQLYPVSKTHPIKGYVQLTKLLLYVIGTVATISVLLDKSPWGILGGIGALTAVLILVFRDTLLSLVATIHLTANDLLHRGDWIEVPECGTDGEVIDITLHTVKVQNWDKTIATVPTAQLMAGSFKNWRKMREGGGRRIKRSLLIDQRSVRICDDELLKQLTSISRLRPYLEAKEEELIHARDQSESGDGSHPLNRRVLTNLGIFRAYVNAYLEENKKVHDDMTFVVRQLPPSPEGLPLEVYVFSTDTDLADYEKVQADIFDHLLAAVPFFDLRVFQHPTGHDLRMLRERVSDEPVAE